MVKLSSYQKLKAESKNKDQVIENLKRDLDAKDQIIDAKNQTIDAKNQTIESKNETVKNQERFIKHLMEHPKEHSLPEEKCRDEEKEHSKSCLGFE